jgi:hypothetical protein
MASKYHRMSLAGLLALLFVLVASFTSLLPQSQGPMGQSLSVPAVAAQGPTPTPNDPVWIAFSASRRALEQEIKQQIQFVRAWTWEDANFGGAISDCRTLKEGESSNADNFGYRFTITLLDGRAFEVRTTYTASYVVICNKGAVAGAPAPAAPAAGAAGAASVAPSGPGGLEVGGQVANLTPEASNAMKSAGMRWVKIQVYNGGVPTDLITQVKGQGFKVLLSVVTKDIAQQMNDPAVQDRVAANMGEIARAGADAIEVWNEPNIEREWTVGSISGGNYTALLIKSYNAIKAANPNTIVISGGPAPTGFFGAAGCTAQGCNDDVFYQQMAQAGAANYMDCVGIHYNEGILSPNQNSGDPRGNYPTYYYSGNVNRAIGPFRQIRPNLQGCFTEIGYLTAEGYGGLPGNFAWAKDTSISEHAQWLGEAVAKAKAEGNIRLFIVFNVNFTTYTDDPQAGYAMIRKDGTCPACATIKAAIG